MTAIELARLEPVDLRQVWQSEPEDFTPWLAEADNIALLGETLGLELNVDSTEAGVGPYRADIVCRDIADGSVDGSLVLIENQLGRTDHSHLGQLLTYAAGLDAVTVVWIAAPFTDEHRSALDWLNEKSDQSVNFFGLEIELWRIGGSAIAPKFNVVAQPNDWNRAISDTASEVAGLKRQQLDFWIDFKALVESRDSGIRCSKPQPQPSMGHPIGRSEIVFVSTILTVPTLVRVELGLNGEDAKAWLSLLESEGDALVKEIGEDLIWHNPSRAKRTGIRVEKELDFRDQSQRQAAMDWLYGRLERFHEVLKPRALALKSTDTLSQAGTSDGTID